LSSFTTASCTIVARGPTLLPIVDRILSTSLFPPAN
jgi:hypothetical protein